MLVVDEIVSLYTCDGFNHRSTHEVDGYQDDVRYARYGVQEVTTSKRVSRRSIISSL